MEITYQILNDAKTLYNFHASFCRPPIRSDLILAAGSHDMRVPEQAAATAESRQARLQQNFSEFSYF